MLLVLLLGFSGGIPLALTGGTLQAWLSTEKIDIKTIGLFSLVGLPYTWKFIWSPFMDRYMPPILGRRRGWLLIAQICLAASIAGLAFSDPISNITQLAFMAVCVAFFSSSQDIVIDAFRTETLQPHEYGAGSGVYILGYRLAMIVSGAVALSMSEFMSWKTVYLLMASAIGLGVIATLLSDEPESVRPPRTLGEAVVEPFKDFFLRPGSIEIMIFILLFKLDSSIASALMTSFFVEMKFARSDIGAIIKLFGMIATIVGALLGGMLIPKLGLKRALIVFGILQGATNLLFLMMAKFPYEYGMREINGVMTQVVEGSGRTALAFTIAVENLAGGMGTAAFTAFLMSLCNRRFTVTQYALLTSLMAVPSKFIAAPTGYLQASVGWEQYFVISTLIAIPGILMLMRFDRWKGIPSVEA